MTEDIDMDETLAGMSNEELIAFAKSQSEAIAELWKALNDKAEAEPVIPESLPTANYFKLSTSKFQMEFNSSKSDIDEVVNSASKIIDKIDIANLKDATGDKGTPGALV